ncbi:Zn-dependent hydrolase [Conexibacter sp. CPCC 206217]|uniref:Zn-dependent hydrolase n=1 Tax=Conexibacter sp. CPCC 206217 TaxID=3064574 RepID=UPI0027233794|nr:Zn-dependent hydrolase [Conexibacter sp. CPCC 206217]MDO8210193.1 Zn-dependent hydrolase [Conexibacter sp. CPCC 206217]
MSDLQFDARLRSTGRIAADIDVLSGPRYTSADHAIRRYAYVPEYGATLDFLATEFRALGFTVEHDPVGTFVARNRQSGTPVFGIGSHCDSNRNGGAYDGTLGVVTALEICRMNREQGLDHPLQVIAFLEEEGSGFGQMLLGSRIMAGLISDDELAQIRAIDDERTFFEHARDAGYAPEDWRASGRFLDDLVGWIEIHIEQGRVLHDADEPIGLVTAIAGYEHGDVTIEGRADHAGATPMRMRVDAALVAAETTVELERLAIAAGRGTVGTVGELTLEPGWINVVPGGARMSLDVRGTDDEAVAVVMRDIVAFAERSALGRGGQAVYRRRVHVPATPMDTSILDALHAAAERCGEPFRAMPSGAAHDTMCVAAHRPTGMVFVPCDEGISHSPLERAHPSDAALAAEITLDAIGALIGRA